MTPTMKLRNYFRRVLISATVASLAGNVVHALPVIAASTATTIVLAAVAPITLLVLVHGLSHLASVIPTGTREHGPRVKRSATVRAVIAAVVMVAAGAFAVSFTSLRELAVTAGWSESLAWLLPAILDLTVVVSTLVLVVIEAPEQVADAAVETSEQKSDLPQISYPALDPARVHEAVTTTADIPVVEVAAIPPKTPTTTAETFQKKPPTPAVGVPLETTTTPDRVFPPKPPAPAALHLVAGDDHREVAEQIALRRVVRTPAPTIARVLAALAEGRSLRGIAETLGVDRSTVVKIKNAAAELSTAA